MTDMLITAIECTAISKKIVEISNEVLNHIIAGPINLTTIRAKSKLKNEKSY